MQLSITEGHITTNCCILDYYYKNNTIVDIHIFLRTYACPYVDIRTYKEYTVNDKEKVSDHGSMDLIHSKVGKLLWVFLHLY